MSAGTEDRQMWIVYDGDCPFCSRYVRMLRLRKAAGDVHLVNAREDAPVVRRVREAGFDLNDGMALVQGERIYFGADCMHRLALMTTPSNIFNTLTARMFASEKLSRLLYPWLRAGRNLTLRLLGRTPISHP